MKRIVLGVCGGVAAYKAAELARLMVKAGLSVDVVMTEAATRFITPLTFASLTGRPVHVGLFDDPMAHIHLSRGADCIMVAPATADFLARLAQGRADDLLSALCLARDCPLLVAPAMNRAMWGAPATRRNVEQLKRDGVAILGPGEGDLACGETGQGRMLEPEALLEAVSIQGGDKPLAGKRVLVTAGPTFEAIDVVRGLTNRSSGKMGYAVARAALEAGAEVVLVSGTTCLTPPAAAELVSVTSAQQMLEAVMQVIDRVDVFVSVAAVADYYVLNPSELKIKKDAHILNLELAPNPDILSNVTNLPNPPFCVGFAAEAESLEEFAELKRRRKRLPLLAGNMIQEAVGGDESRLILFDDEGSHPLERGPKIELARQLIARIAAMLEKRP